MPAGPLLVPRLVELLPGLGLDNCISKLDLEMIELEDFQHPDRSLARYRISVALQGVRSTARAHY